MTATSTAHAVVTVTVTVDHLRTLLLSDDSVLLYVTGGLTADDLLDADGGDGRVVCFVQG